jgi:hypothetical protein
MCLCALLLTLWLWIALPELMCTVVMVEGVARAQGLCVGCCEGQLTAFARIMSAHELIHVIHGSGGRACLQ